MNPKTAVIIGVICSLVGVWLSVAVISDKVRAMWQWGEDGSGPVMSPLGAAAAVINAYLFAALLFARAFHWMNSMHVMFWIALGVIFLTVLIAFRDYARSRRI